MKRLVVIFISCFNLLSFGQNTYQIAVLKYNGGGDWYANPTSLTNLIAFCNENIGANITGKAETVEVGSSDIFNYPFIHMTGHGNVIFNQKEITNLRTYLLAGGFLHIDDNYGMDPFIRREVKKLFPELNLTQLANDHPIFNIKYEFSGLPKIHEHNRESAKAFGIIYEGRLVLLYTYESDLGDGWEDPEVHNDSENIRLKALQMGANILEYVFEN